MGVMISGMLHVANHPDDFLYLYDLRDMLKEKLAQAKEALNAYGKMYRERKLQYPPEGCVDTTMAA